MHVYACIFMYMCVHYTIVCMRMCMYICVCVASVWVHNQVRMHIMISTVDTSKIVLSSGGCKQYAMAGTNLVAEHVIDLLLLFGHGDRFVPS